jgi:hypothetical protein
MAVSKKLRFDVFKRDGFKCQYCGSVPPIVVLEVDHIIPVSKKGTDEIDNLITSCFDCNRGKSNRELTSLPQTTVEKITLLKERESQYKEYKKLIKNIDTRINEEMDEVDDILIESHNYHLLDRFKQSSLKKFINSLGLEVVKDAMYSAVNKQPNDPEKAIRYFCGICWNKIRDING